MTENGESADQVSVALSPLQPIPYTQSQSSEVGWPTLVNTEGSALYNLTGALRQGVKAALPNTQKQTQGGCQIKGTKKYGPNERTGQNPRKRTQQNGDTYAEFKTLVIRMLYQMQSSKHWL